MNDWKFPISSLTIGEKAMNEKINIEFTGEELDEILEYQKILGTDTVQYAIMNAIRQAMDDEPGVSR